MIRKVLPPLGLFLITLIFLEVSVCFSWISSSLAPPPSALLTAFQELHADFAQAFWQSLSNILIGWILSILLGTIAALLFSLSDFLKRAVLPFAIFFQTVPIIAIAPLLVIYFGFGAPTVIVSTFIVSIFPIIANTLIGLESVSQNQRQLFALYHATKIRTLLKLKLPASYPFLYSGLKISAGLAVIGSVAGEFVAGGGLGAMIDSARSQQRIDIVFVSILLLSLIGLLLIALLRLLNLWLNSYRPLGLNLKD